MIIEFNIRKLVGNSVKNNFRGTGGAKTPQREPRLGGERLEPEMWDNILGFEAVARQMPDSVW